MYIRCEEADDAPWWCPPGGGSTSECNSELVDSMVDALNGTEHLWPALAPWRQPLDMSRRPSLLRCISDLGPCGASKNLRVARDIQQVELVVSGRSTAANPSLASDQTVPKIEVACHDQHPHIHRRGCRDASRLISELGDMGAGGHHLQLLRLQLQEEVVATVQLHPLGGAGCRHGVHGCGTLLCPGAQRPEPRLVG